MSAMKKNALMLLCLLSLTGTLAQATDAEDATLSRPDIIRSVDFLPEPPANDSADFARDREIYRQTRSEKGGKRWQQASFDADVSLDKNAGAWFEDAFGMTISKKGTPALYELMLVFIRAQHEAARSAKRHYQRERPYVYYQTENETCAPGDEESHRHNGSYPSGHATMGWGMALILAEITPEAQAAILKRGYEIGQSRVICGFHWQSDIEAGRMVGAAVVAQLHGHREFSRQMEKAKMEIAAIRAKKHGFRMQ